MRQVTRCTLLYTEMITTKAILHGDQERLLGFDPIEHPLSLQLGGDDPAELAECARIAEDRGYDEVNINVGCPSSRVQSGCFGAALMARPERVASCVEEMRAAVSIPVTVKHRIGIDEIDRYEDMARFVSIVSEASADRFTVHARKAWLSGLSPKQNRNVPPLRYDDVYRLKIDFPHLPIEINGGIRTASEIKCHLEHVDAVMIGREAYDQPWLFSTVDSLFFNRRDPGMSRIEVAEAMIPYIARYIESGGKMNHVTRHMLQLYSHQPGARRWKRVLGESSCKDQRDLAPIRALLKEQGARTSPF